MFNCFDSPREPGLRAERRPAVTYKAPGSTWGTSAENVCACLGAADDTPGGTARAQERRVGALSLELDGESMSERYVEKRGSLTKDCGLTML